MVALLLLCLATAAPANVSLAKLDWLTGRWVGSESGTLSEEIWSAAAGDSKMGTWRLVQDGKAQLFEHLALTATADGLRLVLHHINVDGTTWEDKDKPTILPAVQQTDDSTVFEGREDGNNVRLTYKHGPAGVLTVTLVKTKQGATPTQSVYAFKRAAP